MAGATASSKHRIVRSESNPLRVVIELDLFLAAQLAPQYANHAKDARSKKHDAAGLGDGGAAIGATAAADGGERERLRRNRAKSVLVGRGRSAVLVPVDRGANRAAGGGAGIGQGHVARTRPMNGGEIVGGLKQVVTVLVGSQEGVGDAGQRLRSAAE